ncbi:MAG: LacI family transcriptional regulator [Acidimicrobiaceae bacterium]|nr:LacI family transcriptional regulator [Acidimicrobiaceae bacterium]
MRDVAALAGVSLKTVSRVVNGEVTVAEDLVVRVRKAAAQLNYQHNLAASNLRRRDARPSTIGLLIQDVSNQFSASIFRSVEDVAGSHGVRVLASNVDEDVDREHELTANLIARRVDGLIIVPASHEHSYLQFEQRSGTPVVFLDRPPGLLAADSVVSDNELGTSNGVLHLARHGHRRIGYLGESSAHVPSRLRYRGYVEALRDLGITADEALVRRELETADDARAACLDLLATDDPPTALFTAHNRLTVGAVHALRALGLEHTVALVGFDDFELSDLLQPAVSVIAQDPVMIGNLGAEILFRRMHGDDSPVQQHVVPTTLIARGSGEIPLESTAG